MCVRDVNMEGGEGAYPQITLFLNQEGTLQSAHCLGRARGRVGAELE